MFEDYLTSAQSLLSVHREVKRLEDMRLADLLSLLDEKGLEAVCGVTPDGGYWDEGPNGISKRKLKTILDAIIASKHASIESEKFGRVIGSNGYVRPEIAAKVLGVFFQGQVVADIVLDYAMQTFEEDFWGSPENVAERLDFVMQTMNVFNEAITLWRGATTQRRTRRFSTENCSTSSSTT